MQPKVQQNIGSYTYVLKQGVLVSFQRIETGDMVPVHLRKYDNSLKMKLNTYDMYMHG
jgi:hypothetical protein